MKTVSFKYYGWSYAGIGAILVINHGSTVFLTITCVFFSFSFSIAPFVWKDLQRSLAITKILQCQAKNVEDKEPFFMKVYYYSCLTFKITFNSSRKTYELFAEQFLLWSRYALRKDFKKFCCIRDPNP